jgi:hypothetical protein
LALASTTETTGCVLKLESVLVATGWVVNASALTAPAPTVSADEHAVCPAPSPAPRYFTLVLTTLTPANVATPETEFAVGAAGLKPPETAVVQVASE